ncbi:MAG: hypothetical protein P8L36_14880 [SAR324 cluster bacterium]|nr:hypothetical protein [SAR324 cluster bacterium]
MSDRSRLPWSVTINGALIPFSKHTTPNSWIRPGPYRIGIGNVQSVVVKNSDTSVCEL